MKKITLAGILLLSACATPAQQCQNQGFRPGTQGFLGCLSLHQQEEALYQQTLQHDAEMRQRQHEMKVRAAMPVQNTAQTTCRPVGQRFECFTNY